MALDPSVSCRIPSDWKIELEQMAQQSGRTQAQVMYEAIACYLGKTEAVTLAARTRALEVRLAALESQVHGLSLIVAR